MLLIMTNYVRWKADALLAKGAIDSAVPMAELMPSAMQLAQQLKAKGQGPARVSMPHIKRIYYRVLDSINRDGEGKGVNARTKGVAYAAPPAKL